MSIAEGHGLAGSPSSVETRPGSRDGFLAAGVIFLIAAIMYLPQILELGFYRDDWYLIWSGSVRGTSSIVELFEIDRPVMGHLYALTYSVLGNNPLGWHLYAFILRLAGAYAFLGLVRHLFPLKPVETTSMAVLFIVYPGFLQQPNANTFQNHLFGYAAGLSSILLMIKAQQQSRLRWGVVLSAGALLLGLANLLIYEYMIGLEGLRLAILWYTTSPGVIGRSWFKLGGVLRRWAPYGILIAIYLAWRTFIFESSRAATDLSLIIESYQAAPLRMLARLAFETAKDLIESAVLGWFVPFYNVTVNAEYRVLAISAVWALLAIGILMAYFAWITRQSSGKSDSLDERASRAFNKPLILGGLGLVAALLPVLVVNRDVHFHSGFDRYTLHATGAIALLAGGFIFGLLRRSAWKSTIALLVGISAITHYSNTESWARFWQSQRELWWQLAWRAPQIEPGSVLVAQIPDEGFREDYEVWAPANLIYYPDQDTVTITAEILNEDTAEKIRFGSKETRWSRGIEFHRDYNHVLVLSMPTVASCLHVLDGSRLLIPRSSGGLIYSIARYSNLGQIELVEQSSSPPNVLFGQEPEHLWCYYFQKAELASQAQDWQQVAALGDTALALGLKPNDRSEWFPFLQGYVSVARLEDAEAISKLIRQKEPIRKSICDRLPDQAPPDALNYDQLLDLLCEFG